MAAFLDFLTRVEQHRGIALSDWRGREWSFAQVRERAEQLAQFLHSRGINERSRVVLNLSSSRKVLTDLLGVLRTGATAIWIDEQEPETRARQLALAANPDLVVVDALRSPWFEDSGLGAAVGALALVHAPKEFWVHSKTRPVVSFQEVNQWQPDDRHSPRLQSDPAIEWFIPELEDTVVRHAFSDLLRMAGVTGELLPPLAAGDRLFTTAPAQRWFVVAEFLRSLEAGSTFCLGKPGMQSDPRWLREELERQHATCWLDQVATVEPVLIGPLPPSVQEVHTHGGPWCGTLASIATPCQRLWSDIRFGIAGVIDSGEALEHLVSGFELRHEPPPASLQVRPRGSKLWHETQIEVIHSDPLRFSRRPAPGFGYRGGRLISIEQVTAAVRRYPGIRAVRGRFHHGSSRLKLEYSAEQAISTTDLKRFLRAELPPMCLPDELVHANLRNETL